MFVLSMPPLIGCPSTAMILTKRGVMSMPRKLPPFVERWRDRHGKIRVYFRKERGPRIRLPNSVGSDEFNWAYQTALAGQLAPVRERHARAAAGAIGALIIHYKQ